jgi:hypothetical protein
MLTTPHVLAGMALATQLPFPWGLPLALLSHFVLDFLVPHWNPHLFTEMKREGKLSARSLRVITLDGLAAGLSVIWFSWANPTSPLWLGAFLGVLPDFMEIPYYLFHIKQPLLIRFVTFEHLHQAKADPPLGIVTQLAVMAIALSLLL